MLKLNDRQGQIAIVGITLAVSAGSLWFAVRPSTNSTLHGHWGHFAPAVLPSFVLFGVALSLAPKGFRWGVLVFAVVGLGIATLFHSVCVPIHDSEFPAFESVKSLEERAAAGEPFCLLDGHWYQCKSYLSRRAFF